MGRAAWVAKKRLMYFDVVTKLITEIFGQTLIASDSTRLSEARKTQGEFKIFFCLY